MSLRFCSKKLLKRFQPGKEHKMKDFAADMKAIREQARKDIEDGAVTANYQANSQSVIKVLNDALATEIICVLRYRRHYFSARGIHSKGIAEEFMTHSVEEQGHADKIAERISQLNGEPDLNPAGLSSRSHSEYKGRFGFDLDDPRGLDRRANCNRVLYRNHKMVR
jgi:ferritin-like protein